MSVDFKIQNKCDHVINWERSSLESDRKRINLSYPVAATASMRLRINNVEQDERDYSVHLDEETLELIPRSYIILDLVSRHYEPLIESRYVTIGTYCPKCTGIRYLDDISYGVDKDVVTVADELLLIQTLEKYIVTEIGSNKYHTWSGTTLHELTRSKITDFDLIQTSVRDNVIKSVNDLKREQARYQKSGRAVSAGELFGDLIQVDVRTDELEPTTVHAIVSFTAQSGRTLQYEQLLELTELRRRIGQTS